MTKEQWLKIREAEEISMSTWFEYYQEMGGVLDIQRFESIFVQLISRVMSIINGKKVNFETSLHRIYSYYNNKYGLT